MFVQKCNVEGIECSAEIGGSTHLNRHSPHGFWATCIVTLANVYFMYENAQVNGSHWTYIQQLSSLIYDYPSLYIMLLFPLQEFQDILQCRIKPRSIIRSTQMQHLMKTFKCSPIWQISTWESFHVYSLCRLSISFCSQIQKMHVGKLHICVTMHVARNPRLKPTKYLYPPNSQWVFNYLNSALSHPYSYGTYAYL